MLNPYLYPNTEILINKFNIKDIDKLNSLKADFTSSRLKDIIQYGISGDFNLDHLLKFHFTIFQDIYDWSGKTRIIDIEKPEPALGGISIEYSKFNPIPLSNPFYFPYMLVLNACINICKFLKF